MLIKCLLKVGCVKCTVDCRHACMLLVHKQLGIVAVDPDPLMPCNIWRPWDTVRLLQITLKLGAEVPQAQQPGSSGSLAQGTQLLQLNLLRALQLSSKPQALQQVAAKACQALPPHLRACSLVADRKSVV